MKPTVYVETSIISYLTAHLSRDLITAARQQITAEWWTNRRTDFRLFVSQFVIDEASEGDPVMSRRRLEELASIPLLATERDATTLAGKLVSKGPLPERALTDAFHIGIAAVHGVDYLLTWNCKHIANAEMRRRVTALCRASGYEPPIICTPEELAGGQHDGR